MSRVVSKWAFGHMQTAKFQASLRIHAVSPEALLFAFNKQYALMKLLANSKASGGGCAGSPEALLFAYVRRPIF